MFDEVKVCVDAKVNFFDTYFTVPERLQGTVDGFTQDVNSLGETCQNATDFEAKFISSGLSERFQAILQQCTQKPQKMTKEEKRQSVQITKNILKENKKGIAKDMASSVASKISIEARTEMATRNREQMIEDGTYDDYTVARNKINNIGFMARLFKKKTKRNKKEDQ